MATPQCQVVTSYMEYAESALLHSLNNHKHQVSFKSSVLRSMGQKQGSLWEIVLYINLLLASMRNT